MTIITNIIYKPEKQRYWVYVDGVYCTSIRERTFPALKLSIGQEINCEKIKEIESFHWKNSYGAVGAWDKEKVRLDRVKNLIEMIDPRLDASIVGFGADSTELIPEHPSESGKPDIEVRLKQSGTIVLMIEVTGTEFMRGNTYWVRPDKLEYAKYHPEQDVWIILHYTNPQEKFVFINSSLINNYITVKKEIRGAIEHYVEFTDNSSCVVTFDQFRQYLINKINVI